MSPWVGPHCQFFDPIAPKDVYMCFGLTDCDSCEFLFISSNEGIQRHSGLQTPNQRCLFTIVQRCTKRKTIYDYCELHYTDRGTLSPSAADEQGYSILSGFLSPLLSVKLHQPKLQFTNEREGFIVPELLSYVIIEAFPLR